MGQVITPAKIQHFVNQFFNGSLTASSSANFPLMPSPPKTDLPWLIHTIAYGNHPEVDYDLEPVPGEPVALGVRCGVKAVSVIGKTEWKRIKIFPLTLSPNPRPLGGRGRYTYTYRTLPSQWREGIGGESYFRRSANHMTFNIETILRTHRSTSQRPSGRYR